MGIDKLWHHIQEVGEVKSIAEYASQHHKLKGRPLRIVVDAAYGWYKNVSQKQIEDIQQASRCQSQPRVKNILFRTLRLRNLGISLLYVFDSLETPILKGRVKTKDGTHQLLGEYISYERQLYKDMLDHLGIPYRIAPLEAEAECAHLQRLDLADVIYSGDGDTFMFGGTTLIRFLPKSKEPQNPNGRKKKGEKKTVKTGNSQSHVELFQIGEIQKKVPGLDQDGFLLYCLLAGGDYSKEGLAGIGDSKAVDVIKNTSGKDRISLISSLRRAIENNDLPSWRKEVITYFKNIRVTISAPKENWPKKEVVRAYASPRVSSEQELRQAYEFEHQWNLPINEEILEKTLITRFNFDAEDYINWIIPGLVVQTILQSSASHDINYLGLALIKRNTMVKDYGLGSKVSVKLSAVTSRNMEEFHVKEGRAGVKRKPYNHKEVVSFDILDYILEKTSLDLSDLTEDSNRSTRPAKTPAKRKAPDIESTKLTKKIKQLSPNPTSFSSELPLVAQKPKLKTYEALSSSPLPEVIAPREASYLFQRITTRPDRPPTAQEASTASIRDDKGELIDLTISDDEATDLPLITPSKVSPEAILKVPVNDFSANIFEGFDPNDGPDDSEVERTL